MRLSIYLSITFLTCSLESNGENVGTHLDTVRITNGEWEPYLSQYAPHYGLASHIVSEAFHLQGINVEWGFFPWVRSYELAKLGDDWEASAVWWSTDDARSNFLLSNEVVKTKNVFFHLKSTSFNWDQFEDLSGLTVGTTRGYEYGKDFSMALEQGIFQLQLANSDEINLKKLLKNRIDIFPNDPIVGYAQIRNNFSPEDAVKFTHHKKSFELRGLHLLISKNTKRSKSLLAKFNRGLARLRESGRLKKMLEDLDEGKYDIFHRRP